MCRLTNPSYNKDEITDDKEINIVNLEQSREDNTFSYIKYIVQIISNSFFLKVLAVKAMLLITGSAAVLVGFGLELEQTFNDVVSGIILLSERPIRLGGILGID